MTAILSASTAVLKRLYPKGEPQKTFWQDFPVMSWLPKETDFTGEDEAVVFQTSTTQGSSAQFAVALGSLYQGQYNRMTISRVKHYGLMRIEGELLKAAAGRTEGALVNMLENESKGAALTEMKSLAIYAYGNGSGAKAQVAASGAFSTVTATLLTASDAVNFDLNERVGAISTNSLSPTLRTGYAQITGIDRINGTLTTGSNWTTQIVGAANSDYLTRAGDEPNAGTARVITGFGSWLVGGSSPGTLFGLQRNVDPVALAGQTNSYAGVPIEEAIMDASGRMSLQGAMRPDTLFMNPRDVANLKKALGAKVQYSRVDSATAGIGFKAIEVEGDMGPIKVVSDPFCPRNSGFLMTKEFWTLRSLLSAPHLQNYDSNEVLRIASDDHWESRWVSYAQLRCTWPGANFRLTSLGA